MGETGSGSCPVTGFDISGVEPGVSSTSQRVSCVTVGMTGVGRCCAPLGTGPFTPAPPWSTAGCKVATLSHSKTWKLGACAIDCTVRHTLTCTMTSRSECPPRSVCPCPGRSDCCTFRPGRRATRCGRLLRDCRWERERDTLAVAQGFVTPLSLPHCCKYSRQFTSLLCSGNHVYHLH